MSNGSANTHVATINLKDDGTMDIIVQFDGFYSGEIVEISGYVTQTEGAYSSFYSQEPVPSNPGQSSGVVQVPVTIQAMNGLRNQDDITVVTKVAKVWPTVLRSHSQNPPTPTSAGTETTEQYPPPTGEVKATWNAQPPPKGVHW